MNGHCNNVFPLVRPQTGRPRRGGALAKVIPLRPYLREPRERWPWREAAIAIGFIVAAVGMAAASLALSRSTGVWLIHASGQWPVW